MKLRMRPRIKTQLPVPIVLLWLAMPLAAQSTDAAVYAESFRQGVTQVVEESFEAKLTRKMRFIANASKIRAAPTATRSRLSPAFLRATPRSPHGK